MGSEPGWRLQQNPALNGFRAVAVVLVVGVHTWKSVLPGGGIGVAMFFTLSGFLITALLLAEMDDTGRLGFGNFYMRRILRLFPALVACVGVVYLYSRFTGVDRTRIGTSAPAALFYYANWARAGGAQLGMLGHTWSLAVEEQFYLIWPIILWIAYRIRRVVGVLVAAGLGAGASVLSRISLQTDPANADRVGNGFDTQSVSIFIGCALAAALVLGWKPRRIIIGPLAVLATYFGARAVLDMFRIATTDMGAWALVKALGIAAVICWLDRWPRSLPARLLALAPVAYVGRISYGLYLWHYPISAILARSGTKDSAVAALLVLALSLVVASASFFLIERPFLRLKDRFRSPVPGRAPSDAADDDADDADAEGGDTVPGDQALTCPHCGGTFSAELAGGRVGGPPAAATTAGAASRTTRVDDQPR